MSIVTSVRTRIKVIHQWCAVVTLASASVAGTPTYALHPISSNLKFIDVYPTYPEIDYGTGEEAEAIKRGEYLVKLGDCIACHTTTQAGGEAFAGGLPIPTPFGTFYTPNITPDKETGIGNWTEEDFIRVMHEGIRSNGSNSFPAFPYVFFNRVSVEDLKDIWAYMRAIPPVKKENKGNTLPFPLNLRIAQYGWKLLFFYPDRGFFVEDPQRSATWNRGAYIVNGLGHCSMCHTPLNLLGSPKKRYFLTGGFIDGYWAPDITKRGLETATRYEVADVFHEGALINKAGPVRGPMADANHDSLQYLTVEDRLAIAEYLKTVVSRQPHNLPAMKAAQPTLKRGEQVYANVCIICHLNGEVGAPRIHDQANWERRVQQRKLPLLYRHAINGYNKMPAKGACVTCTDEDIQSAVDYLVHHALGESEWRELKNPPPQPRHTSTSLTTGKLVYEQACSTCHDRGELGAPITGDQAQWAPLLRKNFDVLIENTLKGINNMPAKGGCSQCTGSEIIAAVKYMAQESQTGKDFSLW